MILGIGRMDADEKILNEVCRIAGKYPEIKKIMLFGSRAREIAMKGATMTLLFLALGKIRCKSYHFKTNLMKWIPYTNLMLLQ